MSLTAADARRVGMARSDWFVGKGHDTLRTRPMDRAKNSTVIPWSACTRYRYRWHVQEAQAGDMIHNIPELIEYASSLITVFPGDVMQSGTSGGTGAGRVQRATGSGFLQDGETIQASIEGIGTLHRPRRASILQICRAPNCLRSAIIATTDMTTSWEHKIPPHPVSAGFFLL